MIARSGSVALGSAHVKAMRRRSVVLALPSPPTSESHARRRGRVTPDAPVAGGRASAGERERARARASEHRRARARAGRHGAQCDTSSSLASAMRGSPSEGRKAWLSTSAVASDAARRERMRRLQAIAKHAHAAPRPSAASDAQATRLSPHRVSQSGMGDAAQRREVGTGVGQPRVRRGRTSRVTSRVARSTALVCLEFHREVDSQPQASCHAPLLEGGHEGRDEAA
jgi:hypothetical protein